MEPTSDVTSVTQFLQASRLGDPYASEQLTMLVYNQLRRLAVRSLSGERCDHTLQATALVHEAWMRLAQMDVQWQDRVHFYAVAARLMRRILVDYARASKREKRGGAAEKVSLDNIAVLAPDRFESLLILNDTLDRLSMLDRRRHDILELTIFGGLTMEETGTAIGVSVATVHREQKLALAWLQRELSATEARPA